MAKTGQQWGPAAAFLWPALAFAAVAEASSAVARELAGMALQPRERAEPYQAWTTAHDVGLELGSVRLRDFSVGADGPATLICAPYALHGATIADFAPRHSLVEALRGAGVGRLGVTDWRSASPAMRDFSIDTYLADLNVLVDHVGAPVNLLGLCQGGWLALMYAARFPRKVRKLVLAGAPVDIAAGDSFLSRAVAAAPPAFFRELVRLGEGRVLGERLFETWCPGIPGPDEVRDLLQPSAAIDDQAFAQLLARFDAWYRTAVDLPGRYYLEAVEQLFRANALARGRFVALGQQLDLKAVRTPIYLLVALRDELVAPQQVLATEALVGTPPPDLAKSTLPCRHLSLFMGRDVLAQTWPRIAAWLLAPPSTDIEPVQSAA